MIYPSAPMRSGQRRFEYKQLEAFSNPQTIFTPKDFPKELKTKLSGRLAGSKLAMKVLQQLPASTLDSLKKIIPTIGLKSIISYLERKNVQPVIRYLIEAEDKLLAKDLLLEAFIIPSKENIERLPSEIQALLIAGFERETPLLLETIKKAVARQQKKKPSNNPEIRLVDLLTANPNDTLLQRFQVLLDRQVDALRNQIILLQADELVTRDLSARVALLCKIELLKEQLFAILDPIIYTRPKKA